MADSVEINQSGTIVVTPVTPEYEFIEIISGTVGPRGPVGPQGPPGPAGLELSEIAYTHVQSIPSTHWIINHQLNFVPTVTTVDTAGTEQVGAIIYAAPGQIFVDYGAEFSGFAYLS